MVFVCATAQYLTTGLTNLPPPPLSASFSSSSIHLPRCHLPLPSSSRSLPSFVPFSRLSRAILLRCVVFSAAGLTLFRLVAEEEKSAERSHPAVMASHFAYIFMPPPLLFSSRPPFHGHAFITRLGNRMMERRPLQP